MAGSPISPTTYTRIPSISTKLSIEKSTKNCQRMDRSTETKFTDNLLTITSFFSNRFQVAFYTLVEHEEQTKEGLIIHH